MAEKDEYDRSSAEPFAVPAYWQEYLDKHAASDANKKDDKNDGGGDAAPVKVLKRPDEDAITKKIEKEWGITLAPPPPPPPPPPKEEKSKGLSFSR